MGATESIIAGLSFLKSAQEARSRNKQLAAQQATQERQIAATREIEERRRKEQLRTQQASQRARFGALGASANSGSSAAVLAGLFNRSDLDRQDRDRLSNLRLHELRQNTAIQRQRNLLAPRNVLFDHGIGALRKHGPQIFKSKSSKDKRT